MNFYLTMRQFLTLLARGTILISQVINSIRPKQNQFNKSLINDGTLLTISQFKIGYNSLKTKQQNFTNRLFNSILKLNEQINKILQNVQYVVIMLITLSNKISQLILDLTYMLRI